MAENYVAAITARDEPAAAQYTCRKQDGGYLWISAAGKPIAVYRVEVRGTLGGLPAALVEIQVAGVPKPPLVLKKIAGTWCVTP